MKQTTNLKKLESDPLVDLVHDAVDAEEERLEAGFPMYERNIQPTFQKIKRKPKLQKSRKRR